MVQSHWLYELFRPIKKLNKTVEISFNLKKQGVYPNTERYRKLGEVLKPL